MQAGSHFSHVLKDLSFAGDLPKQIFVFILLSRLRVLYQKHDVVAAVLCDGGRLGKMKMLPGTSCHQFVMVVCGS